MRFPRSHRLAWPLIVFAVAACGDKDEGGAKKRSGKPVVWTTFYPTTAFAQRLAGDDAEVHCPVSADDDPIFWKPTREAIAGFQKADLIVINGAGFEKWVANANLPDTKTANTALGFKSRWIEYEGSGTPHKHGPDGEEHTHAGLDGHTWLDPILAKKQAAAIRDGLIRLMPKKEADFRNRYAALAKDLDALDAELKTITVKDALFANHPAYNYLAKRYGWKIVNFDLDPEYQPTEAQIAEIATAKSKTPGRIMLWEAAPTEQIAKILEGSTGLKSIEFSPCEAPPESGDYFEAMKANIARLKAALG